MLLLLATAIVLVGAVGYLILRGEKRVALALTVAPLTPSFLLTLETLDVRTMIFTVLAYPVALLLGTPAYFILRRMGRVDLPWIVLVSMILASALAVLFFWIPRSYEGTIAARN